MLFNLFRNKARSSNPLKRLPLIKTEAAFPGYLASSAGGKFNQQLDADRP